MKGKSSISRRALLASSLAFGLGRKRALAQGFAGLGLDAGGFAPVVPGKVFGFPGDHGPHPDYRIEWWYVTANLNDASGAAYGVQWTLFREAVAPGAQQEGWANQQVWMGHAAATSADTHNFAERFARGGVGQVGVEAQPFRAWIDQWDLRGLDPTRAETISPLEVRASGAEFDFTLRLDADTPLVLQGDGGYSRKSERGQASYYYSQPFFKAKGRLEIAGKTAEVSGRAWMDREWSSQPLASDQSGWDWLSLHLSENEKLMLFRLRQADGQHYASGNWISRGAKPEQIASEDIRMEAGALTEIDGHKLPTTWHIAIPSRGLSIECVPLNAKSWMATSFPYWEGPISFHGSHNGVGYLEMTGY
jgi:predicted secreted hydrolase